jgi:hypothetical protein
MGAGRLFAEWTLATKTARGTGKSPKKSDEIYAKVIQYVEQKPDKDLPASVDFADADKSWQVFTMLEAFTDGMGAWQVMDVLGKPLMELPDALVSDLMTWRFLVGIVKGMKEDVKEEG